MTASPPPAPDTERIKHTPPTTPVGSDSTSALTMVELIFPMRTLLLLSIGIEGADATSAAAKKNVPVKAVVSALGVSQSSRLCLSFASFVWNEFCPNGRCSAEVPAIRFLGSR